MRLPRFNQVSYSPPSFLPVSLSRWIMAALIAQISLAARERKVKFNKENLTILYLDIIREESSSILQLIYREVSTLFQDLMITLTLRNIILSSEGFMIMLLKRST